MATFTIKKHSPLDASTTFAQLLNWDAHSKAIPFTTLHHEGEPRVGQVFNARTAIGPLGFDDIMEITHMSAPAGNQPGDAPGEVSIVKKGSLIKGSVTMTITPSTQGAEVLWEQDLQISWIPRFFDPVIAFLGKQAYGQGIKSILKPGTHHPHA